jgi:hypothetical protein
VGLNVYAGLFSACTWLLPDGWPPLLSVFLFLGRHWTLPVPVSFSEVFLLMSRPGDLREGAPLCLFTRMAGCQKSLDSVHLPIVFHLLEHIRTRNLSDPVDKFTDWKRFQSLASELISPRIQFNSGEEAEKAARVQASDKQNYTLGH